MLISQMRGIKLMLTEKVLHAIRDYVSCNIKEVKGQTEFSL